MTRVLPLIVIFSLGADTVAKPISGIELVKRVVSRYAESPAVRMQVKKDVQRALLGDEKKSEGEILFSKGRLRFELQKPEATLVVMNKREIWVVTPTPKELGGKTQVSHIRSKDMQKQARAPLALLLGKSATWDQFELKKEAKRGDVTVLDLEPKKGLAFGEITRVQVEIEAAKNLLLQLSYEDELENRTTLKFEGVEFLKELPDQRFQYSPDKNSEITVYE